MDESFNKEKTANRLFEILRRIDPECSPVEDVPNLYRFQVRDVECQAVFRPMRAPACDQFLLCPEGYKPTNVWFGFDGDLFEYDLDDVFADDWKVDLDIAMGLRRPLSVEENRVRSDRYHAVKHLKADHNRFAHGNYVIEFSGADVDGVVLDGRDPKKSSEIVAIDMLVSGTKALVGMAYYCEISIAVMIDHHDRCLATIKQGRELRASGIDPYVNRYWVVDRLDVDGICWLKVKADVVPHAEMEALRQRRYQPAGR